MTDKKLYVLCKRYGARALRARTRFLGLLSEVNKRRLYQKKGYGSIFEFAAKLAGVSQEQVRLVLGLEERLADKPVLHQLLVKGEASMNKLARVVSIATVENQAEVAGRVINLSKSALETWVRDGKRREAQTVMGEKGAAGDVGGVGDVPGENNGRVFEGGNGLAELITRGESLPGQTEGGYVDRRVHSINEDLELLEKLPVEVKDRLRDMLRKGIDVGEVMTELLDRYEQEIAEKKAEIVGSVGVSKSRYIPVKIKKLLVREYGSKCSIDGCHKLAQVIHHTQRFALGRSHDPRFLAPLCREHHEIAHDVDARMVVYKRARWRRSDVKMTSMWGCDEYSGVACLF